MDLRKIGYEDGRWIGQAQDYAQWWAVVRVVEPLGSVTIALVTLLAVHYATVTVSSQPTAAMALEFCTLFYTDFYYGLLLRVIYKH